MPSRRRFLRVGTLAALLGVAGCSSSPEAGSDARTGTDTDARTATGTDTPSRSPTAPPSPTRTDRPTTADPTTGGDPTDEPTEEDTPADRKKVDDWQYDPRDGERGATRTATPMATSTPGAGGADGGFAAGGAKDVNNFRQNVAEGYLPLPTDVSYEGLFYDYYFDTGDPGSCSKLFCPTYSPAVSPDPLSGDVEYYATVGLNSGRDLGDFERKTLNLAVVVDTSGSMSSGFGQYYYDRAGNRKEVENPDQPKIEVAAEAIADLTRQLRPDDRFGIVAYDDGAQVAKPLREVAATDMEAIRGHLPELRARGGTDLSAGIETATEMLAEYGDRPTEYETRMVVLTDAMPNLGTTSASGLESMLRENARRGRYVTFVGVGVDFNTEVIDAITSVRGANYYSVRSPEQFEKRLGEQFEYMVTPLVFDLSVRVEGDARLQRVYGTTAAEESTGTVLRANTLFPSPSKGGRTRGGVILAKLRSTGDGPARVTASWEDRTGTPGRTSRTVQFPGDRSTRYANSGVRKAVLLSRYADLIKSWAIDTRERDGRPRTDGVRVPREDGLGKWERRSTELSVSEAYRRRFSVFADYFESEMEAIGDDSLGRELSILRKLAGYEGRLRPRR